MKVSLNWANDYSNVDIKKAGVDEIVKHIGAQLGAIEEVISLESKYKDIIIAKVVSCIKHPNADKLSLCKIDDGVKAQNVERDSDGLVQVVCGAPNVREGLVVAWIPPGATVPSSYDEKEPFILNARELRGYLSNGMLASPSELAISDDHDGILEIENDIDIKPGSSFAVHYGLDDTIIDLENKMFTHRPDCFGILGVARELAGIQSLKFVSPKWYLEEPSFSISNELPLKIKVDTDLVSRFMAVAMSNIKVSKSPINIQSDLLKVGIRPINNIVDITNWLMYLTGQPLHAYDYDKVKNISSDVPVLVARNSITNEQIKLLNGKTVKLVNDKSIIISTDKLPVGIGGVMGGADTEVDENTKNIIIEVATFDMYSIRKTSMQYGLFTDAVTRFNKGQSPFQNDRVLSKAMHMIAKYSGGQQASNVIDIKSNSIKKLEPILVDPKFVNVRLGSNLTKEEMTSILNNVELDTSIENDSLKVYPPFWRQDLQLAEDIVEEIGRLYGFDKLPVELPYRQTSPTTKNRMIMLKQLIREYLSSNGANELLTYNFVHSELLNKVGQDSRLAYELGNAISPSLQHFRLSITPNLLEKVHPNIKAGYDKFCIYEIGKSHNKSYIDKELPIELERTALVFSANDKAAKSYRGAAFYQAKNYVQGLLDKLNIKASYVDIKSYNKPIDEQLVAPFFNERSAIILNDLSEVIGVVGEYKYQVVKSLKLPEYSAGFEIDTNMLLKSFKKLSTYHQISKFPKVEQDITLKTDKSVSYQSINTVVNNALIGLVSDDVRYQIDIVDIFSDGEFKNFTFRLEIFSQDRTLKTDDINNLLNTLADAINSKITVKRI